MKARIQLVAPLALALVVVGASIAPLPRAARGENPPAAKSRPRPQLEPQAAGGGITLEKLWDRWQARRTSPGKPAKAKTPAAAPSASNPGSVDEAASEQLESLRPDQTDGEFPMFSTGAVPPRPTTAVDALPIPGEDSDSDLEPATSDEPEVLELPEPVGVPTSFMAPREAPPPAESKPGSTKVTLRPSTEPAKPIAPSSSGSPLRGTSNYLNDGVRYGTVIRRPSSESLDPTADILGEVRKADRPVTPAPTPAVEVQLPRELDAAFSAEDAGPKPQAVALEAEDVSHLQTPLPTPTAEFSGRATSLESSARGSISATASPAALQQALRRYGAPTGYEPPTIEPVREKTSAPPVPQDDSPSQRSVMIGGDKPLTIDRPDQPAKATNANPKGRSTRAGRIVQGSVAGVDKANRTIRVIFPESAPPEVGSKVQVFHKVLFKRQLLGEFRVVDIQGNTVLAQPVSKIDLDLVLNGDEAQGRG